MPPRRLTTNEYEGNLAEVASAGWRQLKQTTVTVTTADTTYTVTEPNTRRVKVIHGAATYGDIRFNYNAVATTTSFPVKGSEYVTVDAKKDDVLHFIGVPASTVVNVMETT